MISVSATQTGDKFKQRHTAPGGAMVTLRVKGENVFIKVNGKRLRTENCAETHAQATEKAEPELIDSEVADAITRWAAGAPGIEFRENVAVKFTEPDAREPFNAKERKLAIYDDAIVVCGIRVWTETCNGDVRKVLLRLSQKTQDGYEHVRGGALMKLTNRSASNPISRPLKDFRDRATALLVQHRNLDCDEEGIIGSQGGYHFRPWIAVEVINGPIDKSSDLVEGHKSEIQSIDQNLSTGMESCETLNERQRWILEQLQKGVNLKLSDILRHTQCNRSTVNRDMKELRNRKLITRNEQGHYVKCVGQQS